jgi:hypothetical protein
MKKQRIEDTIPYLHPVWDTWDKLERAAIQAEIIRDPLFDNPIDICHTIQVISKEVDHGDK